ncbi:riboflavin biosynthesis protein RibD [Peptoclostridium acidaminophilum DSM 3953]|uniref:Riboflavin biosynthesis protein RibD n=1 Tax=Peptoclostridium acidaminophilum DSM 3953 TaxID=1286171 RepID=W8U7V4_PEPAC|nr:bifunctional diaminohydroxyphosphoribosylaminopyrimidine deaminase/5-amino-6-(5-phosphoribosylamino)uracil reductase RibD [Peptoclostridium acidaminophilum]AHM56966.1 riboflavin biosynthesis protein RibD [Peptoclostridium acidaminophilum DSM 3953]
MKNIDEAYMKMALELAKKGWGHVSPNPLVGCVIIKGGEIIGMGYHEKFGQAHAEVNAIRAAGESSRGATLYVNLEPCCHYGKTPPCSELIIKSGLKRVVVGMRDPNPRVLGGGIKQLLDAGIEVETGVLEEESIRLNEIFIKHISKGEPFVILKTAVTMDGRTCTASGDSKWITSDESRRLVHKIRAGVSCIVTGVETVIKDDPMLNVRLEGDWKSPFRIVLDSKGRIPLDSKVLTQDSRNTLVCVTDDAPIHRREMIRGTGAELRVFPKCESGVDLKVLLADIASRGFDSVLVEAGARVNTSFLRSGLVDKVMMFMAPKILTGSESPTWTAGSPPSLMKDALELEGLWAESVGPDILVQGYMKGERSCLLE